MIEAGGYSLLVRCDTDHHAAYISARNRGDDESAEIHFSRWADSNEFVGETRRQCIQAARKRGWTFKQNGQTFCPYCSKTPAAPDQ